MIKLAGEYNSHGDRCRYYVNDSDDLKLLEDNTFDFIYSNIVLQHMKPEYSKRYIREFLRVLAPGGVLVFQIPSEPAPVGEALLDSAFKARISPHESTITAEAGAQTTIRATVKNISDTTWQSLGATCGGKYQIKLANHWLDDSGKVLAYDDGRVNLPRDLKPMEEIELDLAVNTPTEPGYYTLELDMVQEMVAWFKNKGSETAKVGVKVEGADLYHTLSKLYRKPPSNLPVGGPELLIPKMEMHSVPREEVLELLATCGGKIVDVQEIPNPDWLDFRYCVTKPR